MTALLSIAITKISPTHHAFTYTRPGGKKERVELETKAFLFHDLLHFAVETEAGLRQSFYGLLSTRESYQALSEPVVENSDARSEVLMTERVVGALTGVIKAHITPAQFLVGMKNLLDAHGEDMPGWLTEDFVVRVEERMRRLLGEWNATPFGQSLNLRFEIP